MPVAFRLGQLARMLAIYRQGYWAGIGETYLVQAHSEQLSKIYGQGTLVTRDTRLTTNN